MYYRIIEAQIGIIHANLLDLNHYLQMIQHNDFSNSELAKTKGMLAFLRKHLNKPIMMPHIKNPEPRS